MISKLRRVIETIRYIRTFERRTLCLWGDQEARAFFRYVTKPHPFYIVISNKTIGVGLFRLSLNSENAFKGAQFQALRTNRNRALKLGYSVRYFQSQTHAKDILAVNASASVRQGRAMHPHYTDPVHLSEYLAQNPRLVGVFDRDENLRAYLNPSVFGEVCVINRILGHVDCEKDGVMYLMVSWLAERLAREQPQVKFLMYDTFIGAHPGLRYFKERLGFKPCWVKWTWQESSESRVN